VVQQQSGDTVVAVERARIEQQLHHIVAVHFVRLFAAIQQLPDLQHLAPPSILPDHVEAIMHPWRARRVTASI
jgi:hypothetical protein